MKAIAWMVALLCISHCIYAATDEAKGYLVIEVQRYMYNSEQRANNSNITQSFKIPLNGLFLSQFKHLPSHNSSGTGFCCSGGALKANYNSTAFSWWIRKTNDDRWSINMWGEGFEKIKDARENSMNPTVSDYMTIRNWEDLDMAYQISYAKMPDGINVRFSVKYVSAVDKKTLDAIPEAPVRNTKGAILFKGDDLSKYPTEIQGSFQEG